MATTARRPGNLDREIALQEAILDREMAKMGCEVDEHGHVVDIPPTADEAVSSVPEFVSAQGTVELVLLPDAAKNETFSIWHPATKMFQFAPREV